MSSNKPTSSKVSRKNKNKHKTENTLENSSTVHLAEAESKTELPVNTNNVQLINTMEQYENVIKTAGDRILLIEFFADWCGPCRTLNSKLEELASVHSAKILIVKVDIDELDDLALDFNITAIPTIVVMKNEKKLEQLAGLNRQQLEKLVLALVEGTYPEAETEVTPSEEDVPILAGPVEISVVEPIKIPSINRTIATKETVPNTESTADIEPAVLTDHLNSEN